MMGWDGDGILPPTPSMRITWLLMGQLPLLKKGGEKKDKNKSLPTSKFYLLTGPRLLFPLV